ncbi:MAG TPA: polyprenyl synthetase family protein [Candidatus Binatia bacterium]|nr:polyprenyl synthetase family protein [Candidatus Binatia bacterium]
MNEELQIVPAVLEEYGAVTRKALREYLTPKAPRRYLYDLINDYPSRGGRMLRPSLCLATARAYGAPLAYAIHAAVALELIHNAFLVHDDVEDESLERRGRPTLPAMHGVALSVNVGDALAVTALRALLDSRGVLGHRLAGRVVEETERMMRESIEGQAMDLGWRQDNLTGLDERDYLDMVFRKTCWYTTIYPSRVGALVGGRDSETLDGFVRYGFFLGAAFQIQDDLLNLLGDHDAYGKELSGDLWEGKRTLMVIELLRASEGEERQRVAAILARPRSARSRQDVAWLRRCMDEHGCIEYARSVAHAMAGAAIHEASKIYGGLAPSRDKEFLEALPRWVLARA